IESDGSNIVRFDLERGVSLAEPERRVNGAAHRRIEKGHRKPAVHHADRVVQVLAGFALENGLALLDVHPCEAHRLGDRRRRQPALEHFFEDFEAGATRRCLEQEERVLPADRARALHPRLHHKPEKADITAKIPSPAMAAPLKTLIPRTTAGVSRALSREAASTRMHHQAAEPSSRPATRPCRSVRLTHRKKIGPGDAAMARPRTKPLSSRLNTASLHGRAIVEVRSPTGRSPSGGSPSGAFGATSP